MKWQPIETAPQDGSEVLTFLNGVCRQAAFSHIRQGIGGGFNHILFADLWAWVFAPTHWMPLPEPPNE